VGIYDRDYYRENDSESRGFHLRAPRSINATLIVICVALYLIDALFFPDEHPIQKTLELTPEAMTRPWLWWKFLTYGFVHEEPSPWHIIFNMLQLGFLGGHVERIYGKWEYLRLYLAALAASAAGYLGGSLLIQHLLRQQGEIPGLIGASGAISAVVILFILHYPQVRMMVFPIPIPIKAWVLGVLLVVANVIGSAGQFGNVAYGAHLAGIIFAWLYFQYRWNLGRMFSWFGVLPRRWFRPNLHIHRPDEEDGESSRKLSAEVDRILEKISRQGEGSLSRQERKTLEQASREFQRRRGR
jgi:membrane associated rhomboid family serine protease